MKDAINRLRAALTPQALLLLAILWMLAAFAFPSARQTRQSDLEARISHTLSSMAGAGNVIVTIRERNVQQGGAFSGEKGQSVPCGAVAVAQGAQDPIVALALQEALCALLGLDASSVSVIMGGM